MALHNVGIVGAGPAGVFAALSVCDFYNASVTVFDWQEPLKTLFPTGGGRCNFSYFETDNRTFASYYPRGSKFMLSVLSRFNMNDTVDYFEKIGIKSYVQNDNRIFPISDSAKTTARILLDRAELYGITFKKERVNNIIHDGVNFIVSTEKDDYKFEKLVLATGGKNFKLARKFRHHIVTPTFTLAPLEIAETVYYALSGMSLKDVWVKVFFENKKILNISGDMLFTRNSISGPVVFKISSICAYDKYSAENPLELKINIAKQSMQYLENYIDEFRENNPRTAIKNAFTEFCPRKLFDLILSENGIDPMKQVGQITKKEKELILKNLTEFTLHVTEKVIGAGIVTAGGVDTDEINSATMESKIMPNLYFVGEMINVDGFTGGFNLQNCWSTARVAGMNIFKDEEE
ncbi:MAG: aminoacetone oxidase family FAD-binding enzyme [Candidatus Gastranaerophilales bacterium]|nr:aminoacetone oxidase family FAD-binding enzyme [Candidatus Gastranaerophilales bacterium]